MSKKSIKLPFYGMKKDGRTIFVINTKSDNSFTLVAKTMIEDDGCLHNLAITYNYDCSGNTYESADFINISRKDFLLKVKEIKEKHKVQITVKY